MKFFVKNSIKGKLVITAFVWAVLGNANFSDQFSLSSNAQEVKVLVAEISAETLLDKGIQKSEISISSEGRYHNSPKRDIEGAISDLTQAIKLDPNLSKAYYYRGLIQSELGVESKAIQDLTQAFRSPSLSEIDQESDVIRTLKLSPKTASDYYNRGLVRFEFYDTSGALRDVNRAIQLDPNLAAAYYSRARMYPYISTTKVGVSEEAKQSQILISDYTRAIKINSAFADAYFYRGLGYEPFGNKKAAIRDWTKVIQLDAKNARAYFSRGSLRYRLGDKKGGENDYLSFLRYVDDASSWFNGMPWCARRINECSPTKLDEAPDAYFQLIEQNPKDFLAYFRRGKAYYRSRQYLESINDFKEVVQLTASLTGEPKGAESEFFNAQDYREQAYSILALILYDMKDLKGAIAASTQAIQLDPTSEEVYLIRGRVKESMGNQKGAKQDYARIRDLFCWYCGGPPIGNGEKFYRLGLVLRQKGDRKGAVKALRQAASLFRVENETSRNQNIQKLIQQLTL